MSQIEGSTPLASDELLYDRAWVVDQLREEPQDLLGQVSQEHLRAAWNDYASDAELIDDNSVALEVHSALGRVTSRDLGELTDRFGRAVASIARELSPNAAIDDGALTQADYARAPIYPMLLPSGVLTFSAAPGSPVGDSRAESISESAMARLVSVLPEHEDDPELATRLLGLAPRTARAVLEVAEVAKRVHGLTLTLHSKDKDADDIESVMTSDQARNVEDLLGDASETFTTERFVGKLDGMRMKRRMFYLELDNEKVIHGVIDEAAVSAAKELLDTRVAVRVERVIKTSKGRKQRPVYRLLEVRPAVDAEVLQA